VSTQTKWITGIFGFLIFIFFILLILPFMIDFNRFKPQIQNIIGQKLNAKVDFSSARLTIFSGLGIELENVKIENTDELFMGTELFKVKNIKFKTELFPLLQSKFVGKIEINNPEINLMRSSGRNNITSLVKKQNNQTIPENSEQNTTSENAEKNQETNKQTKNSGSSFADKIFIKSFEIKNATFHVYNISGSNEKEIANIKNMNLTISNIGVAKDTKIDFSTDIDIKNDDVKVKGLVTLNLILNTELEGTSWKNSLFNAKLSFNNLDINFRDAFVKKKSVPFYLSFSGIANPKDLMIEDFKLNLQSIDSKAKMNINGYDKLNSDISVSLSSNNMSDLGEIFPQHKQMLLNATLDLKTRIIGALTQPETLIINLDLKSKLSNSDINLVFAANSIKPLIGSLRIQSQNLYLSQIIKPFMTQDTEESKKEVTKNEETQSTSKTDKNKSNEEILKNNGEFSLSDKEKKLLADSDFSADLNVGKMVYDDLVLNNFSLAAKIKNYNASLSKLSMNIFSGNLTSNAAADLGSSPIPFNGNVSLSRVKVEDIFKFVKPESKKSPIEGHADIKMNFNAKGITRPSLSKTLNAKGSFLFSDGMLNTKSLVSLAGQQFNQFVSNTTLGTMKIDSDVLKKLSLSDDDSSKKSLKNQRGDFEVKDGKLLLRNNIASDDGTLKLHADVGLDESLKGNAVYIASHKIKERLVAQSKYAKYLLNEKGEFELDLTLAGTVSNPDVTINTSVLQTRLVKNASKELTNKIKEEIKKSPEAQKIQEDAKKLLEKNGIDLKQLGF
jgi:AsmA protein